MKKASLLLLTLCVGAFADSDTVVRWRGIEGIITAPGIDNPVGQIHGGAGPWTTKDGSARVNLVSGEGSFEVEGLVMNGGPNTGTPGGVGAAPPLDGPAPSWFVPCRTGRPLSRSRSIARSIGIRTTPAARSTQP